VGLTDGAADTPKQLPDPSQTSFIVNASPSSQGVPIGANGSEHIPLLQVPAIWHCEIGVHVICWQSAMTSQLVYK